MQKITVTATNTKLISFHDWRWKNYGCNLTQEQKREALQKYIQAFGVTQIFIEL